MKNFWNSLRARIEIKLFANFAGAGWTALMQLLFIPQYIRLMGMEAFGLVGFYLTLQGILQVFDLGLSPTMNREMARYSVQAERAGEARDFAHTVEIGYWALGALIGISFCVAAPFIATRWINAQALSTSIVEQAIVLMGVLTILQWPLTLYLGGLMGLQRQAEVNILQIVLSTLNNGGAFLVLLLVSPTIIAFLIWQIAVNVLRVILLTFLFWHSLPPAKRAPRVNAKLIRPVWRFAAGMSGITLSALILTQLDKVILSKLLSLEMFGVYTLATVIAGGLTLIITSIFNVIFPHLAALTALGDAVAEKQFYHRSAQVMSVVILPIAALIAFFPFDILRLWTGNTQVADNGAPIVALLIIGTALNGLMNLPYALQLAHGWTSLGLRLNAVFIAFQIPGLILMTVKYGAVGAAAVWIILNAVYMLLGVPLTHRRLLVGEARRWLIKDTLIPCIGAMLVIVAGRVWLTNQMSAPMPIVALPLLLLGAFITAGLAAGQVRQQAFARLANVWAHRA